MATRSPVVHGPALSAGIQQTVRDYPLITTLAAGFLFTVGVTSLLKSQALVSGLLLTGAGVALASNILQEGDPHWDRTLVQIKGVLQGLRDGADPTKEMVTPPWTRVYMAAMGALAAIGACMFMGASLTTLISGTAAWIVAAMLRPQDMLRITGADDAGNAVETGRTFGEAFRPLAVMMGQGYAQVSRVFEGFNGAARPADAARVPAAAPDPN